MSEKDVIDKLKQIKLQNDLILNFVGEGIFGIDKDGIITFANPCAVKLLGYFSEEMIGKCQHKLIHHTKIDGTVNPIEECNVYRAFREGRTIKKDDEIFWKKDETFINVEFTSTPIIDEGEIKGAVIIFRDITDYLKSEKIKQELIEKEIKEKAFKFAEIKYDELKKSLSNAPAVIAIWKGIEHIFEFANDNYSSTFGGRQLVGKPIKDALSELSGQGIFELLDEVYKTGKPYVGNEVLTKIDKYNNGELHDAYWNFVYQPIFNDNDEVIGISDFAFDVTEQVLARKKIESLVEELTEINKSLNQEILERQKIEEIIKQKEKEKYFETLTNNAPVMIWIIDENNQCTYINKEWCEFTGKPIEESLGKGWLSCIYQDDLNNVRSSFVKANEKHLPFSVDYRLKNYNGEYIWTVSSASPRFDANGTFIGYIGSVIDINERKIAETKLKENEERYSMVVEGSNEGVWDLDLRTGTLYWSKSLTDILGMENAPEKINISTFIDLLPDNEVSEVSKLMDDSINNKTLFDFEFKMRHVSGKYLDMYSRGKTYYDENDKPTHFAGLIANVTAKKEAEKEKTRLITLVENSSDLIGMANMSEQAVYLNKAGQELIGLDSDEEVYKTAIIDYFMDEDKPYVINTIIPALFEKGQWAGEFRFKNFKTGQIIPVHYNFFLVKDPENGENIAFAYVARDITEMQKQKIELKRSNEELQQFAYIASHDLQSPLRTISGYTQLLFRRNKDKFDDDAKEFMNFVVKAIEKMQSLINDLLDYSRVGTSLSVNSVDCNITLLDVLNNLDEIIKEKNASITHDKLPILNFRETLLYRLFQNLISNSIKFNVNENPAVHISVKRDSQNWVFSIADNGIGIEKIYSDKIFQIFQRLNSSEKYEGTGIGLAVCKKIVEKYNGKIWFESIEDKGTTFYFSIPDNLTKDSITKYDFSDID